ncbi:MAG: plasmid pRiA4b ORF-3 family protein [Chlorobiales bacterium]|nr:plasmid pRiA4b ORF-3 family protein [Chlorobiales bacterium]
MSNTKRQSILQLKVTLRDIKPPIWRRIVVPDNITLGQLHDVLQIVMGWTDSHLHQFILGRVVYGIPDENEDNSMFGMSFKDENKVRLSNLLSEEKDSLSYEYDFGDGWQHKVTLEKKVPDDSSIQLPRCIKGKRACPPEDCGGVWGYVELLEIMSDKSHPEYKARAEWLDNDFDPEYFDLAEINAQLMMEGGENALR